MKLSFPLDIPHTDDETGSKLEKYLKKITEELEKLTTRNIDLRQNCRVAFVEVTTAVADTEVTIAHNLGVTPFMYVANIDLGGYVYDSSRSSWDGTNIYIKCSVANAAARLLVFG